MPAPQLAAPVDGFLPLPLPDPLLPFLPLSAVVEGGVVVDGVLAAVVVVVSAADGVAVASDALAAPVDGVVADAPLLAGAAEVSVGAADVAGASVEAPAGVFGSGALSPPHAMSALAPRAARTPAKV